MNKLTNRNFFLPLKQQEMFLLGQRLIIEAGSVCKMLNSQDSDSIAVCFLGCWLLRINWIWIRDWFQTPVSGSVLTAATVWGATFPSPNWSCDISLPLFSLAFLCSPTAVPRTRLYLNKSLKPSHSPENILFEPVSRAVSNKLVCPEQLTFSSDVRWPPGGCLSLQCQLSHL